MTYQTYNDIVASIYDETMLELIDDMEVLKLVKERQNEESVKVSLDDLDAL